MHDFIVDTDKCVSCGLCVKDCVNSVLELKNGYPEFRYPERCIGCLHCYAICPTAAIRMDGHDPADAKPIGKTPALAEVGTFIRQRRSIRLFRQENIDPGELRNMLEMAWSAPSGVNQHLLQISLIDDIFVLDAFKKDIYCRLAEMQKAGMFKDERLIGYLGPTRESWLEKDVIFRHAPHMVVVSHDKNAATGIPDCLIYLSYLEMIAYAAGFGTLWCGMMLRLLRGMPELAKLLDIPENYEFGYAMLLGKPDVHYARGVEHRGANIRVIRAKGQNSVR